MNANLFATALSVVAILRFVPDSSVACSTNATALSRLAVRAVSPDVAEARSAIAKLRDAGPAGLEALLNTHAEQVQVHSARDRSSFLRTSPPEGAAWERLRAALDGVGGQRDCHASQLYWHTDIEQAKAAAKSASKPILSLRLLGRLDEEFSCANSRFFRTTLYANHDVARFLRDNFVLHWKSVRPAPRVTIDFGDGRKIERTIAGNSIHYLLDADGRVIDALPGLYGPHAFLRSLTLAKDTARKSMALDDRARAEFLGQFHRDCIAAIGRQWVDDLSRIGKAPPSMTAVAAVQLRELESATDEESWGRIASLHALDAKLDTGAAALIRARNPTATDAGRLARTKAQVEDPLLRLIRNLERSIAEDTVRNEYRLHTRIHEWLASTLAPPDVDSLNAKVYAELFLTPDSDPWLGLAPRESFSALENDGLIRPASSATQTKIAARPSL